LHSRGGGSFKNLILNGFRPVEKFKKLFNPAFTLAEVLITLGIIGVVAAMTIPTLMAKIRRAQYSAAFKKGLSTLNQAVKMNYANYGWDFSGVNKNCHSATDIDNPQNTQSLCAIIGGNLKGVSREDKYSVSFISGFLPVSDQRKDSDFPWTSDGSYMQWRLADGVVVGMDDASPYFGCFEGSPNQYLCQGFIDVNSNVSESKPLVCEDEDKTRAINAEDYEECTISDKNLGNVVPIFFYDQTVIPGTNAARALLNGK
jgi:prepilin-type N-terminal cleavage/methylation domain-containing protein